MSVITSFSFSFIRGGSFPVLRLFLLTYVSLLIFHIPRQVQFHLCFCFPDPISVWPDYMLLFFPGHTFLLPLPVHFLLIPQYDQQVHAQPYQFPVSSAWFLILGVGELFFPDNLTDHRLWAFSCELPSFIILTLEIAIIFSYLPFFWYPSYTTCSAALLNCRVRRLLMLPVTSHNPTVISWILQSII